ncbi:hypothetical protein A0H81_00955 [Grifola frondosa]|uniref:Uncharacterized protein n=1 Tax=Grifola frondosa TaxID=5627 RepID=A0A1C7MTJ6_GRIFR|nr:hypothetical protein A0H81_00955 [Grifola frondosa]
MYTIDDEYLRETWNLLPREWKNMKEQGDMGAFRFLLARRHRGLDLFSFQKRTSGKHTLSGVRHMET